MLLVHGTPAAYRRWASISPRFEQHFPVTLQITVAEAEARMLPTTTASVSCMASWSAAHSHEHQPDRLVNELGCDSHWNENMTAGSMWKRLLFGILGALTAYVAAAIAAYFLVGLLSTNTHDRALEAAMSAAFFYGPAGAVVGFVLGCILGGRGRRRTA